MGGGKGGSSGGGSTTVTNTPPAQVLQAYQQALGMAGSAASTPLQLYQGQQVAGFTPDQLSAFQTVNGIQGNYSGDLSNAASALSASQTPLWNSVQQFSPSSINQYMSPYNSSVVSSTEQQLNNQDAQQQNSVVGNAVASGAWGGDRSAVAQAQLAGQQDIANNSTIANLENTGYTTAEGEFNNQQQSQLSANEANSYLNSQAAYGYGNLANLGTTLPLEQANAQESSGALQQSLNQENLNVPYEQYLEQQAYPFQTAQYFSNIAEGLGSGMGGTSTSNSSGASTASQIIGGGLGIGGLLGESGLLGSTTGGVAGTGTGILGFLAGLKTGGRVKRDAGGSVDVNMITPGQPISGLTNSPLSALSPVPQTQAVRSTGMGIPHAAQTPGANNNAMQSLQMQGMANGLKSLGNAINGGGTGPAPYGATPQQQVAQDLAEDPESNSAQLDGIISGLTGGQPNARGGRIRRDSGGTIDGMDVSNATMSPGQQQIIQQYMQMSPTQLQQLSMRMPPNSPQGAMIQKVLQQKQMMPTQVTSGLQAPQAPTTQQGAMARGGRLKRDDGGALLPDGIEDSDASSNVSSYDPNVAASPDPTITQGLQQPAPVQREQSNNVNPWEAMAAAGFGMMAGRSRQAGVNIGEGALTGLQDVSKQRQELEQQRRDSADIDDSAERLKQQAQQIAQQGNYQKGELALDQQKLTTMTPYDQAMIDARNRELDQQQTNQTAERQKPIPDGMGGFIIPNLRDPANPQRIQGPFTNQQTPPKDANGQPLTGDAYLATQDPRVAAMAKQIGDNTIQVTPYMMSRGDPITKAAVAAAKVYNPNWDMSTFDQVKRFSFDPNGGVKAKALDTVVPHMGMLEDLVNAMHTGDVTAINKAKNALATNLGITFDNGKSDAANLQAASQLVGNEIINSTLASGKGALGDRDEIQKNLGAATNPEILKDNIDKVYWPALRAQANATEKFYTGATKQTDFRTRYLLPETSQRLWGAAQPSGQQSQAAQPVIPQTAIDALRQNPDKAADFAKKYGVSASQYIGQ